MDIKLGNVKFNEVEKVLGYRLNEADEEIWNKFQNDKADLSGKDSCFHIFDMPKCIVFKGEEAKQAILKLFSPEKLIEAKGKFKVYEVK
jgi:hypothetical protein